jgi:uncharacterized protein YhaN
VLNFDPDQSFHLIYGPNEAGKSSALRAIKALLFGVPERTQDNFLHDYNQLRVAAILEDGEPHFFRRRKGRTNTLLDAKDSPLDAAALEGILGGITQKAFEELWGLDYVNLRKGSQELLQEQGDLTSTLFRTGGLTQLTKVVTDLETESKRLLGVQRELRKTYNESTDRARKASVSASQYAKLRRAEEEARVVRDQRDTASQAADRELAQLKRIRDASPLVAQYLAAQKRLAELGLLPDLPPKTRDLRTEAERALGVAEGLLENSDRQIRQGNEELAQWTADPIALDHAEAIRTLVKHSERALEGKVKAEVQGQVQVEAKRDELQRMLRRLGIANASDLPDVSARKRLRSLGKKWEIAYGELKRLQGERENRRQLLARQEAELSRLEVPQDLVALSVAIRATQELGNIESRLRDLRLRLAQDEERLEARRRSLTPGTATWSALAEAPIPNEAAIAAAKSARTEIKEAIREVEADLRRVQDAIHRGERELRGLETEGTIPNRNDLLQIRSDRDAVFEGLQDETGKVAYRALVKSADRLADGLFEDAAKVASAERIRNELRGDAKALAELEIQRAELLERESQLAEGWNALWAGCGFTPQEVEVMERWTVERTELLKAKADLTSQAVEAEGLAADIADATASLSRFASSVTGGSLKNLLDVAVEREKANTDLAQQRLLVEQRIAAAKADLGETERSSEVAIQAERDAEGEWRSVASMFDSDAPWQEIQDALDGMADIDAQVSDLEKAEADVRNALSEYEAFASRALALRAELGEDAVEPSQIVLRLSARLESACAARDARQAIEKQLAEAVAEAKGHRADWDRAHQELNTLMKLAGVESPQDLALKEDLCEERDGLRSRIRGFEEAIDAFVGEGDFGAFIADVREQDQDSLAGRIAVQRAAAEAARAAAQTARDEWTKAEYVLKSVDGESEAEAAMAEAMSASAGMAEAFERFAGLQLVRNLIRAVAERYREENQGPVLRRAGALLATLTGGDFTDLHAVVESSDEVQLRAVRQDGSGVTVDAMSEGTRDSLFLALRLASLESRIRSGRALPLILDDVLIHLDDRRAGFALQALAEFSSRTQVILLTHHQHLIELAEAVIPARHQSIEMV